MKSDYPLFLPNVVYTSTSSNNKLTDPGARLAEARRALFSILEKGYFNKVIVVDGSNHEIVTNSEIYKYSEMNIEIEQLQFQQNVEQVKTYGKSNGECQITAYMLKHSRLVKNSGGFYKLSPRYYLDNIDLILPKIEVLSNVFYYYNHPRLKSFGPFVCTAFYKTSVNFYNENLSKSIDECGLDVSGYLESVFFRNLRNLNKVAVKVEFPKFSGLGGTLGVPMKNRYYFGRNFMSKRGFLAYSFDENAG